MLGDPSRLIGRAGRIDGIFRVADNSGAVGKLINLDGISIFVAAAEAGTFSAAAGHLQLPPSTVSRSLTRLEKDLDLLLVRRSQRGLSLTDAGKEYLLSCKRALRALREGRELLDQHRASPFGLLRVACPMTMARDAIAPLLSEFIKTFPDLRMELETYSSSFDQEPKEDIDVFFKVRTPKDSSRRIRSYPGVARGLFASSGYVQTRGLPAEPEDLVSHRGIGSGRWILSKGRRVVTPDLTFHVLTDNPLIHRQIVLDGAGIAILPLYMALESTMAKPVVRVLQEWRPKPVVPCALNPVSSRLTPKVRVFLDFIQGYIGTDLDPRLRGARARDCFTEAERDSGALATLRSSHDIYTSVFDQRRRIQGADDTGGIL
jgi:LysR family transcriptional regulator, transcriptional activator for dmlA